VALSAVKARPSTVFAVLFGFILQMLCGLGLLGTVVRWKSTDPRTYLSVIVAFWVFDAVRFLTYTTVCGIVGHWYFFDVDKNGHPITSPEKTEKAEGEESKPVLTPSKTPVLDAFVRAMSRSAGPISLGALLISLLKIFQFYKESVEDVKCPAIKKALLCCVKCFKSTLEKFKEYAFVFVAVYGSGFLDSASESRKLVESLSLDDTLLKHKMVEDVRNVGVLVVSLCSWAATFGVATYGYDIPYQVALPQSVLAMWISGCVMAIPMVLLEAPLATLVILFGTDDGAAMEATKPDTYAALDKIFRVLWKIKYLKKDLEAKARGCCSTGGKAPDEEEVAKQVEEEEEKSKIEGAKEKAMDGIRKAKVSMKDKLQVIKDQYSKTIEGLKGDGEPKSVTKTEKGDDAIEMS